MASPETIDFEALLAPISSDQPAGVALRDDPVLSSLYYQIKDAREAARTAERQLARAKMISRDDQEEDQERDKEPVAPPDWRKVLDLSIQTLATKSKDLWITAWAIEALSREHGFAGLRDGFRLARELSQRYWDAIHPRPDEDGIATTVAQLTGLNGQDSEGALVAPIQAIPITRGVTFGPLTGADYLQATDLQQMPDADKRAQRIKRGAVTLEMFDKAVSETPPEFFLNLLEDLQQALDEFSQLNDVLEQCCGRDADGYPLAPPSSNIRSALVACCDRVKSLAREVLKNEGADPVGPEASASPGALLALDGDGRDVPATAGGRVQTREDAFRALLQVADFFRRTEPHSPVSYALQQAVRWGRMSLPELMNELISDRSLREEMFRRVGIPSSESSDADD